MGVLLELKGMGCRHLEHVLQARETGWYHFLSRCMDYGGIFMRLDLAINDMGGLLDIEILREFFTGNAFNLVYLIAFYPTAALCQIPGIGGVRQNGVDHTGSPHRIVISSC